MEEFQVAREKALKNLKIADHMISVTYPLLRDNKLLVAATENLFLSVTNAMAAILYYDRLFKLVPPFSDEWNMKYEIFRKRCIPRHGLDAGHALLIKELRDIISLHRKSPVEFSRKDAFVICGDDYRMKTISQKELKDYLAKAKVFIQSMVKIVEKNEGIFG